MSSFGEELRRERELRQITLREISEATKISLRHLEGLEKNDFTHLPGGVFNKGFVRAYAQYIGVDPETMVNAYLLEARSQQPEGGDGLESDVFRPSSGATTRSAGYALGAGSGNRRWIVLLGVVAVAVLISALGWWWWTTSAARQSGDTESVRQDSSAAGPSSETPRAEISAGELDPAGIDHTARDDPPAEPLTPGAAKDKPAAQIDRLPVAAAAAGEFRVVVQRPTQGRLNCDNKRVEILDGLTAGTELVLQCRSFLMVDALDGGALLVQQGHSEAKSLATDGVPVMRRYPVPPKRALDVEGPS